MFAETAVLKNFVKPPGKHLGGVLVSGKMQAANKKDSLLGDFRQMHRNFQGQFRGLSRTPAHM